MEMLDCIISSVLFNYPKQMDQYCLPDTKFKLMKQVYNKYKKAIKACMIQPV